LGCIDQSAVDVTDRIDFDAKEVAYVKLDELFQRESAPRTGLSSGKRDDVFLHAAPPSLSGDIRGLRLHERPTS